MTRRNDWGEKLRESGEFTFDDIEPYTLVRHRGKYGRVTAIGQEVLGDESPSRHIKIEYNSTGGTQFLHENVVNQYLYARKRLWVDWNHVLDPFTDL